MESLRRGKAELHRRHSNLPLKDKVRIVIDLQRICWPLLARQGTLPSWRKPWEVEP
jgi:hypothetical protein